MVKLKPNLNAVHHILASSAETKRGQHGGNLGQPAPPYRVYQVRVEHHCQILGVAAQVVVLKAKLDSSLSYYSFERLFPGAFNVGFIGSTCTALPWD